MVGYVTVEQADLYIKSHYLDKEDPRTYWESLNQEDKEILLRRAADSINLLPYPGRKTNITQENAFPRFPATSTPVEICSAQIELALSDCDSTVGNNSEAQQYLKMRSWGIQSYTINDLSETIGSGGGSTSILLSGGITSPKVQSLLEPLIGGGYTIE